jgi:hypothetical protein
MTGGGEIGRDDIMEVIRQAVEPLDCVHAMWEGGAAGFGRLDRWSDLDVYIDADDDRIDYVLGLVERALIALSPIELEYRPAHALPTVPERMYAHAYYKLEKANRFLLVDVAVIKHGSPEKFLEPGAHGHASFIFNKGDALAVPRLDHRKVVGRIRRRLETIGTRLDMFGCFITKELDRGNVIEALDIYRALIVGPLVEVLRIKHLPARHEFGTRYIHYDLPRETSERLAELFYVAGPDDLTAKWERGETWLRDELSGIDIARVEENLRSC